MRNGEPTRYSEEPFEYGRIKCRLIFYKSPSSTIDGEVSITRVIQRMEEELKSRKNYSSKMQKDFDPYYEITPNKEDGGFSYKLNKDVVAEQISLCGCFAIFCTREDLSCEEVLDLYRAKDCVEKAFASYKNDILDERIRTKSSETLRGKLFLSFIGLIIRKTLETKLKST